MNQIILFGAGIMGQYALDYYEPENVYCFSDNDEDKIGTECNGKKIISFKELIQIESKYDIVISCQAFESIARQFEKAGISNYKKFVYPAIYDYVPKVKESIAKDLLSSERLDVIVKYLYCKDVISGDEDSENKSLYARMMLTSAGCSEKVWGLSPTPKEGLNAHFKAVENLCQSMQEERFIKESFIPIDEKGILYNGAHRLAAALALNEKIYTGVCGEKSVEKVNFKWFEDNGFSTEDKMRILKGFADLYDECGIFVLYGSSYNHWNYIEAQIKKEFNIVGLVDIDLSHNFIAYEILVREIYGNYDVYGSIADKISFLKMAPLIMRVILVSDEDLVEKTISFYDKMTNFKKYIRESLDFDLNQDAFCTLHATSCKEEFNYLKNIILSVNNLKSIEGRITPKYRKEFIKRIKYFKRYCMENGISMEDICVTGSSTMEVLGIRDSNDLDFAVLSNLHYKFQNSDKYIGKNVASALSNYSMSDDGREVDNDLLIHNDSYHFWFYGCKFVNLEFVKRKKENWMREKDVCDLRLIELYSDFIRSFNDKKNLERQINKELERRKKQVE